MSSRVGGVASGAGRFGQGIWGNLGKTGLGRAIQEGIAADYGFIAAGKGAERSFSFLGGPLKGGSKQFVQNMGAKSLGSAGKSLAGRLFPMAYTGYQIYSGFQEGGVTGAVKGAASAALWSTALSAGKYLLDNPMTWLAAGAVAAGIGGYAFGEAAQRYGKRVRGIEMGGGVLDQFGTVATLRQRSLMALQNTHLNGRQAIGMEAQLMHM